MLAKNILLVAAVALVDSDGKVLLQQRPKNKSMAGLWEFPGGKVEFGETPEQTVVREANEELGIDVTDHCLAPLTFGSHPYKDFHLLMPLYVCRRWDGVIVPQEEQKIKWLRPLDMRDYPMPPADVSLVAMLRDIL